MSLYQRDHFELSLRDLLARFDPPCPKDQVKIKYIPIVDPDEGEVITNEPISLDIHRWLEHSVRDSCYCWCDNLAMAACAHGFVSRFYIIELEFKAWSLDNPNPRQIYANELGKIYLRHNGYINKIPKAELEKMNNCRIPMVAFEKNLQDNSFEDDQGDLTEYYSH